MRSAGQGARKAANQVDTLYCITSAGKLHELQDVYFVPNGKSLLSIKHVVKQDIMKTNSKIDKRLHHDPRFVQMLRSFRSAW